MTQSITFALETLRRALHVLYGKEIVFLSMDIDASRSNRVHGQSIRSVTIEGRFILTEEPLKSHSLTTTVELRTRPLMLEWTLCSGIDLYIDEERYCVRFDDPETTLPTIRIFCESNPTKHGNKWIVGTGLSDRKREPFLLRQMT